MIQRTLYSPLFFLSVSRKYIIGAGEGVKHARSVIDRRNSFDVVLADGGRHCCYFELNLIPLERLYISCDYS